METIHPCSCTQTRRVAGGLSVTTCFVCTASNPTPTHAVPSQTVPYHDRRRRWRDGSSAGRGGSAVRMMGSSLEAGLGDIFKAPDERILKAVEKAGNRYTLRCPRSSPQSLRLRTDETPLFVPLKRPAV